MHLYQTTTTPAEATAAAYNAVIAPTFIEAVAELTGTFGGAPLMQAAGLIALANAEAQRQQQAEIDMACCKALNAALLAAAHSLWALGAYVLADNCKHASGVANLCAHHALNLYAHQSNPD